MRYYIDTEFIEDGVTVDLISIGVVAEDGREFYAESADVDLTRASDWVKANVVPHLTGVDDDDASQVLPRSEIAERLREFIGAGRPEFWSWCSAYDWVALCQLYGMMMDKPASWPSYCADIQQEMDRLGLEDGDVPAHPGTAHDALADAHWHRAIHEFLRRAEAAPAQVAG